MTPIVAVFGASGLVGSTLVEQLLDEEEYNVRALIHSSGNAWRLGRLGIELQSVDLLSEEQTRTAIAGAQYVINCSRGPRETMWQGLKNLLNACRQAKVQRLVHISSSAVFGESFPPDVASVDESFPCRPAAKSYGGTKLKQDQMVEAATRSGLPAVVLCPPNISGPASTFLCGLVQDIRGGRVALIDEGESPCPLVDVRNLAHAVRLALNASRADGRRILITDSQIATWAEVVDSVAGLVGREDVPHIGRDDAERLAAANRPPKASVMRTMKHLISSDVRSALGKDPLLARVEEGLIATAGLLPASVQDRLRDGGNTKRLRPTNRTLPRVSEKWIAQQLRGVGYHSTRAEEVLEYRAPIGPAESFLDFADWYRTHFGMADQTSTQLLQHLWT